MYLEHFGLTEYPFGLTPNTRFFCALPSHQDALNVLLVALNSGEGFIKITGEVGTGKTLLCRKLLNELDTTFVAAYIPNPALTQSELLLAVVEELGIAVEGILRPGLLLKQIYRHLLDVAAEGKRVVLVLDEAQAMPHDSLELLRLLTNLETESSKLLQIVLFGQPELDDSLARPDLRQLRQRITFSQRLEVLDRGQTRRYLFNRLRVAGYTEPDLFTRPAYWLIHVYSQGTPRLINILAHKAMMAAYGQGRHRVRASHVRAAAADGKGTGRWALSGSWFWWAGLAAATAWAVIQWRGDAGS
ncbi:MAG: AAA family ATPase [Methylococcaceae bacterium]|nr:AAA family ATPase [Methylococcaceae bacterium]